MELELDKILPLTNLIILPIVVFLGAMGSAHFFLSNIVGEKNAFYVFTFILGFATAEFIHGAYKIYNSISKYHKAAILHCSHGSSIQIAPVKQILNNEDVKLVKFDFTKFSLEDRQKADWNGALKEQEKLFRKYVKRVSESAELYYFGHASIPLAIHLGYLFSLRYQITTHQHLREKSKSSWGWSSSRKPKGWKVDVDEPDDLDENLDEIAILIEQSASIKNEDVTPIVDQIPVIRISIPKPDIQDLKAEQQAIEVASHMKTTIDKYRNAKIIHLFCAIPSPTAFLIGQNISDKMHPEIALYEYTKILDPPYEKVIVLNKMN